jgi:transposase
MRPIGTAEALEKRRRRAVAMLEKGMGPTKVAEKVGTSYVSVYRWQKAVAGEGASALIAKPVPGRPSKLAVSDYERLLEILLEGAIAYGYPNEMWTLKRIASVIRRECGVIYHPNHVWKILRGEGWSCQVPERRALQRREEAIEEWKRQRWPGIKKNGRTWRPPRLH